MCGADAACAADMLDVPGGPGDTSVSHSVEPSPVRTNGSLFTVPARKARQPKNPFLGASANFFFAQDDMLRYLAANHTTIYCQMPWSGPTAAQTTYASNDPAYADLNDAAKQAELQEARAQVAAQPTYSYGVAPIGGNDTPFANEFAFIRQMMSDTIHAPAPISAAERVAMRERVRHFQALVDAYNAVTTFSCVNTGIQWIGRPQISLPNAHSTPMAVSRETASAARHDGAALGDAMNGGGGGGTPPGQHGTTFVAPPSLTTDQIVAAARALQDQILQAILEEKDRGESGCFSKSRRDCDWFPEDAAPRAVGLFAAEREADFQECVRWTGSATTPFTDGSIRGAGVADVTYRLISLRDAALRALNGAPGVDAPVGAALPGKAAPPTNRQAMGQVIAGNKYIGDSDWFGGGFRYAAFWKVSPASFHGPLRDIGNNQTSPAPCELEGQVHGELHARADVLKSKFDTLCSICEARFENVDLPPGAPGVDVSTLPGYSTLSSLCGGYCPLHYRMQHLVDTQIDLKSTHADGNLFTGEFFFGGERIWQDDNPGENLTSPIHESYPGTPEHVDAIDTTVWVSVVPVTLMVQGEVHYGVDLDAAITNSPDYTTSGAGPGPSISVEARFRPWAYVDAIGSVGIGFDFAQAGVRGRVRVVDASLPVWGKVWVDQKELHAALDAHLDIAIADGSMSVFGKLGPLEAEKEIFSWTGYHDRIQILGYQLPPIAMPVFNESTWSAYKNGTLGK